MTGFSKKTLITTALIGALAVAPAVYAATDGATNGGLMNQGQMNQGSMNQGSMGQGNMGQGNMGQGSMGQGNMNQGSMGQGNMNQGNMGQGNMMGMAAMMGSNMGQMPKLTDEQVAYMTKMLANLPEKQRGFVEQMLQRHGVTLPETGDAPASK